MMSKNKMLELIQEQEKKGRIVVLNIDGACSYDLDEFIKQPADGILYDLNRDKVTCASWIDSNDECKNTWVNNYAVALVIHRLKELLEVLDE